MSRGVAQETHVRERDLTEDPTSATAGPTPAAQVAAWLRATGVDDVHELATVAYAALTGVDPVSPPVPPRELVPGFPALVDAALMRALTAQPEGRPTAQALLALLEKTPARSWPAPVGHNADVEYRGPAVDDTCPSTATVEPTPLAEVEVEVEVTVEQADPAEHAELAEQATEPLALDTATAFRSHALGRPARGHAVPVFQPLEGAGELPASTAHPTRRSRASSQPRSLIQGADVWENRLLLFALLAAITAVALLVLTS